MESKLIPAGGNLIEEVAALMEGTRDFSRYGVVFQGKRPAHFLRRSLALRAAGSLLPPRIFSIDQFVDFVYRDILGRTGTDVQAMDAAALLFEIHSGMDRRLGGGTFAALDSFLPFAQTLFGALEELSLAETAPEALGSLPEGCALENADLLQQFYREFYLRVQEIGCSTRSMRYRAIANALGSANLDCFDRLIVAGFFGFTGAERRIMRGLAASSRSVFLFQDGPGIRRRMEEIGITCPVSGEAAGTPTISVTRSPDTHGEVFGLARKLRACREAGQALDERTVIVLPASETLFPVVHWALPLLEEERYNVSLAYPGDRTPVSGFLSSLMQLVLSRDGGRLYAPDYTRFILHPYTKNIMWSGRADVTRMLFHAIEERLLNKKSQDYLILEELEQDSDLLHGVARDLRAVGAAVPPDRIRDHLVRIHDQTIRSFLGSRSVGDCARRAVEVLSYISNHSTAHRHQLFRPFVLSLMEQLDQLAHSRLASVVLDDPARYCAIVRSCLGRASVPFHGTPLQGVQVLGFLETRNLRFDRVFMLDANDDILPGIPEVDLLLPPGIRQLLGLPGRKEREEIAAYHFAVLTGGAQEVHLMYREGGKKEKSRFVERLLWEQQEAAGVLDTEAMIHQVAYGIELANHLPAREPKTEEICRVLATHAFSATALDGYLKCPLRFHYAHVMGLEERDEVDGNIDRAGVGRFVHNVLATFDASRVGQTLRSAEARSEELTGVVDRLFAEEFGENPAGSRYLLREQIKHQLCRYLAEYRRTVLEREEVQLVGVEHRMSIRKNGYHIQGIADRIERRGKRLVVLDFKTGADDKRLAIRFSRLRPADRETWSDAIGSLQLPLYMLLCAEHFGEPVENIVPAYCMLGKNSLADGFESPLFSDNDPAVLRFPDLERVIFGLLDEITDRATPFVPPHDLKRHCPSCSFTHLCGTQWISGHSAHSA